MKIAYIASEVTPYASTGGLAEVAGALPHVLAGQGHTVFRFMPCYRQVLEGPRALQATGVRITVPVGMRHYTGDILRLDEAGVTTFFIRRDEFFDRTWLYNLPDRDYEDNFERFVFFQKAVVALLDHLDLKPDIVHGNDWQAGLLPYFLEYGVNGRRRGRREKVVFSIHNIAYQGIFPDGDFALTNLPFNAYSVNTFEYYGKVSCLKAGITGSDWITTVSPTYAREVTNPGDGFGLDGLLRSLQDRFSGILNGIDTELWNPARDPHIAAPYDARNMAGKKACRDRLLRRMEVKADPSTVVVGMISRLVDQKGLDLLAACMNDLLARDVSIVLLGSGQKEYEAMALDWGRTWAGRVGVRIGYDARLAHEIQAGSDIMLIPSKTEPCGLTQFCSQRYGTLPLVHSVGGLADSVADADAVPAGGTGIAFAEYTAGSLLDAMDRAIALCGDAKRRASITQRIMRLDLSWASAAKQYCSLYNRLLNR